MTTKGRGGSARAGGRWRLGVLALLALVTAGWMAGIGLGVERAVSDDPGRAADIGAWLDPALQGVLALAIVSVALALTAIGCGVRSRATVMSDALPRLLDLEEDRS